MRTRTKEAFHYKCSESYPRLSRFSVAAGRQVLLMGRTAPGTLRTMSCAAEELCLDQSHTPESLNGNLCHGGCGRRLHGICGKVEERDAEICCFIKSHASLPSKQTDISAYKEPSV